MYLSAISVGYAVPCHDFNATVHSVFRSAVNLLLEHNCELFTINANSRDDLPQGIRIDTPKIFSFEKMRVGEIVTCREGRLHLKDFSLTIDIRGARNWKCNLPSLMVDVTKPTTAIAWRNTWKLFNERQRGSGLNFIKKNLIFSDEMVKLGMLRKVEEAILDLVESTRRYNLNDTHAVGKLIGLGAGLTPSCDDFLVGYLAGLWSTVQGGRDREQFIKNLGKEVLRLSLYTNDISRTYLYHATCGQVSSLLVTLVESICRGENSENLIDIAEAAMQVGHMSGMASVCGLLLGLAVWDGKHLLRYTIKTGL
jgi:hypothetical protein